MIKQSVLFEARIEVDILESRDGFEWGLCEHENAAKAHKKTHEAFRRWCKTRLSKDNKKDLMLKLVEHVSDDKNAFSIRLMVGYDGSSQSACEQVNVLKNRLNHAIKGVSEVFQRIHEKNPKNPSAVLLSLFVENENTILVESEDVLTLAEELRQNLSKRKDKITLKISDEGEMAKELESERGCKADKGDKGSKEGEVGKTHVVIGLHDKSPVLQQENKSLTLEVKLASFSDDNCTAEARLVSESGIKYSFSWSASQSISGLREKLLMDLKDKALVKLLVCPLTQLRNGREVVKGYSIVEYLGRAQDELDFGS